MQMVTTGVWSTITLMVLSTLIILLHVLVMITYCRRFAPSAHHHQEVVAPVAGHRGIVEQEGQTLWSGVYLILRHNYVLLILGVSCLYEVSLTCLNYQMTLLGWKRFEETEHERMSFQQFMGHYGQMVNVSSLILSSLVFPFLIQRVGLRLTLRLFPTLLIVANILAFGILPRNLTVLFFSLSLLKAMTYSIHDPSKEILYLPTSNAIKFKSKFWIDVVGARIAKAIGSSINRYAGSVDRSIRVASTPSFLTAGALLYVCYKVGIQFEVLVATKRIVGVNDNPDSAASTYAQIDGQVHMVDSPESDDDVFEDELLAPTGSSETGLALTRLG
jgi:ATP/ADP translocase